MGEILCPECSKELANTSAFITHYKKHSSKQIRCYKCPAVFTGKSSFYHHLAEHKKPVQDRVALPSRALLCSHCKKVFTSLKDFKKHVGKLFESTPIDCPSCSKKAIVSFCCLSVTDNYGKKKHIN